MGATATTITSGTGAINLPLGEMLVALEFLRQESGAFVGEFRGAMAHTIFTREETGLEHHLSSKTWSCEP